MRYFVNCIFVAAIVLASLLLFSSKVEERGRKDRTWGVADLPWHMADVYWMLDKPVEFESLSIDFTLSGELPERADIFFAPLAGDINGQHFYAGLVTEIGHAMTKRNDGKIKYYPERGGLFSKWGVFTKDALRTAGAGYYMVTHDEGDHVSVRPPISWKMTKYTISIRKMDYELVGSVPYVWAGCFLHEHESDESYYLGSVRHSGTALKLSEYVASFLEVYTIDRDNVDQKQLSDFGMAVGNLRIDGKPVDPPRVAVHSPEKTPRKCIVYSLPWIDKDKWRHAISGMPTDKGACLIQVHDDGVNLKELDYDIYRRSR